MELRSALQSLLVCGLLVALPAGLLVGIGVLLFIASDAFRTTRMGAVEKPVVRPAPAAVVEDRPIWWSDNVLFQRDGRWQVTYANLGGERFVIVGPTGEITFQLQIKSALPVDEYEQYVYRTGATVWNTLAFSYFVKLGGEPHFCARTWWDRRIVIDLKAGAQVADAPFEKVLDSEERRLCLETLTRSVDLMARWQDADRREIDEAHSAIHLATRMQLKEAIPLLRQFEAADHVGVSGTRWCGFRDVLDEDTETYRVYSTRQRAQLALRRLGARPAGHPAMELGFGPVSPGGNEPRHERARRLKRAMDLREVLELLGAPDYTDWTEIHAPNCVWRYDMDADEPYSLLVSLNSHGKVTRIERFTPPLWKADGVVAASQLPVLNPFGSINNVHILYGPDFEGERVELE